MTSQSLAGKPYLVWFYPKAQTPGCTAEGRGIRDRFDEFRAKGVQVVGVSFDTPAANAEFVKAEGFQFRLLSDTEAPIKRVARQCGFGTEETMRRSFLRLLSTSPQDYRARFSL